MSGPDPKAMFAAYAERLAGALKRLDLDAVERLAQALKSCWQSGRQVFLVGNGGSAGNANHLANDYVYALSKRPGSGIRAHGLAANPSVVTCLANDEGYDSIYALQLAVMARPGDVLIAFSGSGNSPNILRALEEAKRIGMTSFAVLGYSGGKAKALADVPIHVAIDDMQVAEDLQMAVGHMIMQWLYTQRDAVQAAA
ncbi:SIS domain-containing protein [Elioraea sp.]|uniref:SIS domain-containing protein n=1 Tax=Elioraea sp. TaxID=2185103 RepID=UPI003F6FD50D